MPPLQDVIRVAPLLIPYPVLQLSALMVYQFLFQKTKAAVSTYMDIILPETIIPLGTSSYTVDLQRFGNAKTEIMLTL